MCSKLYFHQLSFSIFRVLMNHQAYLIRECQQRHIYYAYRCLYAANIFSSVVPHCARRNVSDIQERE